MKVTLQNDAQQAFGLTFDDALGMTVVDTDTLTVTSSDATIGTAQLDSTGKNLYVIGQKVDGDVTITVADQHGASGTLEVTFVDPTAVSIAFTAGAIEAAGNPIP